MCIDLLSYKSSFCSYDLKYMDCVVLLQKETEKLKEEFEKERQTFQAKIARHEKINNTLQVLCGSRHVNAKCMCWSVVYDS